MKKNAEEAGEVSTEEEAPKTAPSRGLSILDFILRLVAAIGTLGSAIAMGTTNDKRQFFTHFMRFKAKYQDLPTFTFFVFANAIACTYLVFSLFLSIFHILKTGAKVTRTALIALDMIILALLTASASATAAIAHLAHKGNIQANWFPICQQHNSFCERVSGTLVGSFTGVLVLMVLIILSALALSRQ